MERRRLVKGEILCLILHDRKDRRIYKGTVTKIGRKYFYVQPENWRWDIKFYLETWREVTEYSPTYVLYETEQHYQDEVEKGRILDLFSDTFRWGGNRDLYTLDQLREGAKILKIELDQKIN